MAHQLTHEIINAAIEGFEQQRARIDQKIAELQAMRSGLPVLTGASESVPGKRKRFSAAVRRKMAMAQKARWAKLKGEPAGDNKTLSVPKTKRKMSKEGRERIVAATKARWARVRAEKEAAANAATAKESARNKKAAKGTKRTLTAEPTS